MNPNNKFHCHRHVKTFQYVVFTSINNDAVDITTRELLKTEVSESVIVIGTFDNAIAAEYITSELNYNAKMIHELKELRGIHAFISDSKMKKKLGDFIESAIKKFKVKV